jgi:mRNA interferase MazF
VTRGSIHWVQLDKRRPAVVISPDRRNELAADLIILPCSTQLKLMVWHVLLKPPEGGLTHQSMVKCELVTTVPKQFVDPKPLGPALSPRRLREIERALMLALGILVPGALPEPLR